MSKGLGYSFHSSGGLGSHFIVISVAVMYDGHREDMYTYADTLWDIPILV